MCTHVPLEVQGVDRALRCIPALHKKRREARKGVSAGSRTRKKIFILFGEKWLREGEKQNNRARSLRGVSVAARRVSKAMAADVRAVF